MRALLICGFIFAMLGALLKLLCWGVAIATKNKDHYSDIFAAMTQATIATLYYMLLLFLP